VPSPDGRRIAWTSSRAGGREGQIFLADWNHQAALEALANAPIR
jgi:Tol biopolymer transport system component